MIMKKNCGDKSILLIKVTTYFNLSHIDLLLSLVTLIWICLNLPYGQAHTLGAILERKSKHTIHNILNSMNKAI